MPKFHAQTGLHALVPFIIVIVACQLSITHPLFMNGDTHLRVQYITEQNESYLMAFWEIEPTGQK